MKISYYKNEELDASINHDATKIRLSAKSRSLQRKSGLCMDWKDTFKFILTKGSTLPQSDEFVTGQISTSQKNPLQCH